MIGLCIFLIASCCCSWTALCKIISGLRGVGWIGGCVLVVSVLIVLAAVSVLLSLGLMLMVLGLLLMLLALLLMLLELLLMLLELLPGREKFW